MRLAEFLAVVLVLELTPGPNMGYLAALAATRGRAAGLLATAGVAAGLSVHALLAALGVGAAVARFPLLYEGLRWAGVAYLLFLAWEGWRGEAETSPAVASGRAAGGDGDRTALFRRGLVTNLLNPKSALFFVSVVPGFAAAPGGGAGGVSPARVAALGAIYVAVATAVHASVVLLAATARPWLAEGHRAAATRRVLSCVLVALAAWLAWTTRAG